MQITPTYKPKLIYLLTLAEKQLHFYIKNHTTADLPSATQTGVLFALHQQEGLLMGELADRLKLVPSAISGLIQRMEDSDLIIRQVCSHDARATRIYLSNKAKIALPVLLENTRQINQTLMAHFSQTELETVEKWLKFVAFDLNKKPTQD